MVYQWFWGNSTMKWNEKKAFPKFGNGKGMKKSIPIIRERESDASILGNGREREFPLTPDGGIMVYVYIPAKFAV